MKLLIGQEERVFNFISKIGKNKTALISHIDLDGIAAAKVVNSVIKFDEIRFVNYGDLNLSLVEDLKKKKIKKIVFTDLYIKDKNFIKNLEEFAEVLILDHHLSPDWNSNRTVSIRGEEGYSAGYLCYFLFSKIKNLEEWDWLVACSCVSDCCHIKPWEWLSQIYKKYGDKLEHEGSYVRKE
jgi:single-stranded DNA-specific DHH superfamily exonuclease